MPLPTTDFHLYLIGPVTGCADDNRLEFERVRALLTHASNGTTDVVIPHDFIPSTSTWQQAMSQSISRLVSTVDTPDNAPEKTRFYFDGVATLDGWQNSRGATLETLIASELGIPCYPYQQWQQLLRQHTKISDLAKEKL